MTTCSKVRYRDRVGALFVLSQIRHKDAQRKRNKRETRAYRCDKCRGWHLTSKE